MRPNQKRKKKQGFFAATFNRLPLVASVILGSLLLSYLFVNENGLPLYLYMIERQAALNTETQQLIESNAELREEINHVQHDPSRLEQLARNRLGMVREGEIVYQFVEPKSRNSETSQ